MIIKLEFINSNIAITNADMKMIALGIPWLVVDKYVGRILVGTYSKAKSAKQLSEEFNIPIFLCYNRIRLLERAGLIKCVGKRLNRKGREVGIFKSELKKATVFYRSDSVKVRFEFASGLVRELEKELKTVD